VSSWATKNGAKEKRKGLFGRRERRMWSSSIGTKKKEILLTGTRSFVAEREKKRSGGKGKSFD